MAITIGATPSSVILRLALLGAYDETATNAIVIDGTMDDDDAALIQFLTDYDAVSRAGLPSITVNSQRVVAGQTLTAQSQDALSLVNNMVVLNFKQAHPLNPALTIEKSVQIRAPQGTVITTKGALVVASVVGDRSSADENLRGIINFLEDHLIYKAIDDSITIGGWTWDETGSKYVAAPAVIDGL